MQLGRHYSSMREAFLKVDSDRSGWLSPDEFATIFRIYNIEITGQVIYTITPQPSSRGSH